LACAHLRRTKTGTSAAAKSGATNPSATAITSELFVSHTNSRARMPHISCFPAYFGRFTDWQLYRHLPADAEGKAFAKDFVATPPAVPQPPTQPLATPQPLTVTSTATATPEVPKPAAPAKPATAATAPPHPAGAASPSASSCCVLN
jgi:hypothetical protein